MSIFVWCTGHAWLVALQDNETNLGRAARQLVREVHPGDPAMQRVPLPPACAIGRLSHIPAASAHLSMETSALSDSLPSWSLTNSLGDRRLDTVVNLKFSIWPEKKGGMGREVDWRGESKSSQGKGSARSGEAQQRWRRSSHTQPCSDGELAPRLQDEGSMESLGHAGLGFHYKGPKERGIEKREQL